MMVTALVAHAAYQVAVLDKRLPAEPGQRRVQVVRLLAELGDDPLATFHQLVADWPALYPAHTPGVVVT